MFFINSIDLQMKKYGEFLSDKLIWNISTCFCLQKLNSTRRFEPKQSRRKFVMMTDQSAFFNEHVPSSRLALLVCRTIQLELFYNQRLALCTPTIPMEFFNRSSVRDDKSEDSIVFFFLLFYLIH